MTLVITAILAGGVGAGVWVLAQGLRTRPVPLAALAAALDRTGASVADPVALPGGAVDDWRSSLGGVGVAVFDRFGLMRGENLDRQLRALGRTREQHAAEKLFAGICGFALPPLAGLVFVAGGSSVSPSVLLLVSAALGLAGFFYPDLPLAEKVEERRRSFRYSLSAYLDLVTISLAGGGGIETALESAADSGDGWAFAEIHAALRRADIARVSPWQALRDLGDELGADDLKSLAATISLAGGSGAKIRQSLVAKADALRDSLAAEVASTAEAQSEKMIVPVVVLILGLMLFIGFGAVQAIGGDVGPDMGASTRADDGAPAPAWERSADPGPPG